MNIDLEDPPHRAACAPRTIERSNTWLLQAVLAGSLSALGACATTGSPSVSAASAPATVSLDEYMSRGDTALQGGDRAKAREVWRAAAKDYPAAKQPWLKLAQDFFNAQDYGNAVLAAQEAVQRDPRDRLANSVLAVGGLRLTAGSLQALRGDGTYPVGSRDEALAVTRQLREALGESSLVSSSDAAASAARTRHASRPVHPGARAGDLAAAAPAPTTTPSTTSAAARPTAGNPLDKLK